MKKPLKAEPWRDAAVVPCTCSSLRRTSRAVTALYDQFLAEAGLTVTQYSLLVSIARTDGISRTGLAARLGMERTTLTRNLRPLERDGFVAEQPGADRRERVLRLTASGQKQVDRSFPLWQRAQQAFFEAFGDDRLQELNALLDRASDVSKQLGRKATTV